MARDFNGTTDSISIGDIAISNSGMIFVSLWVNMDVVNVDTAPIFSKTNAGGTERFGVWSGTSGLGGQAGILVPVGNNNSGDFGYTDGSAYLVVGTWIHVFVAYDGGAGADADQLKIFTQGVQRTLSFNGNIPVNLGSFSDAAHFGLRSDSSGFLNGKVAEFAIWVGDYPGGVVTAQQAASILSRGYSPSVLRKNGLHYYPLIGRHGAEVDVWGGNSGVLTGTTASPHPRVIMPRRTKARRMTTAVAAPGGRIWKLAGYGGGLVGQSRGLAG